MCHNCQKIKIIDCVITRFPFEFRTQSKISQAKIATRLNYTITIVIANNYNILCYIRYLYR